ncbi:MAG: VirB4 family type IV secretion/conjugal transfer ATPase, partial [Shewanella sp.]|nr:VirB4 family type IV secretion/conjugal transfer ATPase [Shewanella sp.]
MTAEAVTNEWQRENTVAEFIPFQTHIDEHTVNTHNGDLLQVIKLKGVSHETLDAEQINLWKEQFNLLLRNISSPNVCLWTHIIRREHKVFPEGTFDCEFDRKLNEKYAQKVCQSQLMVNELYLTVVYATG